jgi:hypothetical protein
LTLDNIVLLAWLRRILITLAFLTWVILGYRTYVLKK